MPTYRVFGMGLRCDVAIPALAGVRIEDRPGAETDVHVHVAEAGSRPEDGCDDRHWYQSAPDDAGHVLRVTRSRVGAFRLAYTDGTQFIVSRDGGRVTVYRAADATLEDATEYLLGPVIALVLRMRGIVCLHASAVAAGDGCFAVLAPAGHGKSTTAAACARIGLPVLSDDVLALHERDRQVWVLPAYPRVRLWPEAVEALFGSADALPRITPENDSWPKRYLDLTAPEFAFQRRPLPLRSIYTHEREQGRTPSFERLSGGAALVTLLGNVYSLTRPKTDQRAREFDLLGRVARSVPVKRYRGRYGLEHVDEHCRALFEDCLGASRAAAG